MFRWVLWKWEQARHKTTYYFRAYTREPFHAWLYWSYTRPIKAVLIEPARGGWCIIGDYWWPMPAHSWEQLNPGNTLVHAFTTPPLTHLHPIYLMVFPSNDPSFQASTSPHWAITPPAPPYDEQRFLELWNTGEYPWRPKPNFSLWILYEPWSE